MKVPSLSSINLQEHELNRLLKMIVPLTFRKDKTLLEEGKPVINIRRGLYLIVDGEIIVTSSKGKVQSLKMGDFFGEDMLNDDSDFTSPHTIIVSANAKFDVLTIDAICSALGGLHRLRGVSASISNNFDKSITSTTFNKVTILGAGTFGQVWLVTDKKKHTPYALKIQNKHELLESEQYHGALREKSLMSSLNHPFIVQLVNSFQDENNLFMVMTFVQGGELFNVIHTDKTDGIPEVSARFYSANIYDALMYLHERQILYRDLKPENVLINEEDGYCVLIDLGFAKEVADKTYTLCGTPLYLAPEVILSRGYDKSVDNWSFGALIFEMVAGYSPFYSPDIDQMTLFKRIVSADFSFPTEPSFHASAEVIDLVLKILVLNPSHRLGSLAGGNNDIRNHPWLASLSPSQMMAKKIKAPWKPNIADPTDTSNFEKYHNMQDKQALVHPALTSSQQNFFSSW